MPTNDNTNIAGNCPGCIRTFEKLDQLLEAATAYEVEVTKCSMHAARLHALAAVCSWWMDRTLKQFLDRRRAVDAVEKCLWCVKAEQGLHRP